MNQMIHLYDKSYLKYLYFLWATSLCEDKTKKVLTSVRPFVQSRANDLKSKKICTYCSSGYTDELSNQGFDAKTIEGGYSAWKDREKRKRCDYCFI